MGPAGLAAAGFVDPEDPHRFVGVFNERGVRGRPRHARRGGDLDYRKRRLTDTAADLSPQPGRGTTS
ncbi:hypothetical protein ACLQ3C_21195 [Gordonia sp. DT30]|uniref:hypothetical protein n=1 Tax=Gordonia sp. DT30 TaxID=3416546 RepID=UPI003CF28A74